MPTIGVPGQQGDAQGHEGDACQLRAKRMATPVNSSPSNSRPTSEGTANNA